MKTLFKRSTRNFLHFSHFLSCKKCALNRAVLVFPSVQKSCSSLCFLVFSSVQKSCSSSCFLVWAPWKLFCFVQKVVVWTVLFWSSSLCKKSCSRLCSLVPPSVQNRALDRARWCSPPCKNRALACESCYRQWARHKSYVYYVCYMHITGIIGILNVHKVCIIFWIFSVCFVAYLPDAGQCCSGGHRRTYSRAVQSMGNRI